jgi:ribosomal protein S1
VRRKLVWDRLAEVMRAGREVEGRVLNVVPSGYAVGVAGYVALLPTSQARPGVVQSIGTLQPFYIQKMEAGRRLITLTSWHGNRAAQRATVSAAALYSNIPSIASAE